MASAGFPVPGGFCVTTSAYRRFIAPVAQALHQPLEGLDPRDLEQVRRAGEAARALLLALPLPEALTQAIEAAWSRRSARQAYAVRSSATAEDLPGASFAGQQDTYLNVVGLEALLEQIRACFASLFTDRAILYRIQRGFAHRQVALSVVVQEMVFPEISGIAFTADPATENRRVLSIDAGFGLGEALVSGLINADLYKVDRRTGATLERKIATKALAIEPVPGGGTQRVELPPERRDAPALDQAQLKALVALCEQVEAHYGAPQDIEWCIAGGALYLTQARPITSLYPPPRVEDEALHVFLSLSHLQVMTDPMPALASSLWLSLPTVSRGTDGEFRHVQSVGGRLFADFSPVLRHPAGRRALLAALRVADPLARAAIQEVTARPAFLERGARLHPASVLAPLLWRPALRALRALLLGPPQGAVAQANALSAAYLEQARERLRAPGLSREEQLDAALEALRGVVPVATTWLPRFAAGALAQRLLRQLVDQEQLLNEVERGMVGNIVTEMNLAMGDLADGARGHPALLQALAAPQPPSLEELAALPGGEAFVTQVRTFLRRFGARGPSEIDISRPRWSEDPGSLLHMVASMTRRATAGSHRAHHEALVDAGERAAAALPLAAPWWARPLARHLLRLSRALMPLREHHKFLLVQVLAEAKRLLWQMARGLVAEGALETPEDIWHLRVGELRAALQGQREGLKALVEQRRQELERHRHRSPPRVLTSDGEQLRPQLSVEGAPRGALVGSAVSAGVREGTARVVRDPAVESLEPGEVLVARFTDPGWTPLFVNAAALVTEVGGLMTHGSVVAREYGIPAVVSVVDATSRIQTGDRVRVNGDRGYVELLPAR